MPIRPKYVVARSQAAGFRSDAGLSPGRLQHLDDDDQCASHRAFDLAHANKFEDHETPDQAFNPNGNAVALEVEMIKVSDTQAQFQAAANLYAKAMTHDEDGDRPLI